MTLNEKKIQKGIAMNKMNQIKNNIGNVSYQLERRKNLFEEYTIHFDDYESEEPKKSKKKEKKQIKIEKKKDIMKDILKPIKSTKKKIIIEEVESNESESKESESNKSDKSDDKQTGGGMNENKTMKKLFITANLKPETKKNELIL